MKNKIPHIVKKFKIPIRKRYPIYTGADPRGAHPARPPPPPKIGKKI